MEDRFKKLSDNYGKLFNEVWEEQGLNGKELEESVYIAVKDYFGNSKDKKILDIGVGDGETIAPFVKEGYKNLVGVDLNPKMIKASKKRFDNKVKLISANATSLNMFKRKEFDAIITALCIHNISKEERTLFWKELLRLSPEIFVAAEKIADSDPIKHKKSYENEIKAIIKVYKEKHNLPEISDEWIKHYEVDEKEKLTIEEIKEALSESYNLEIIKELGMCKTIVATKK